MFRFIQRSNQHTYKYKQYAYKQRQRFISYKPTKLIIKHTDEGDMLYTSEAIEIRRNQPSIEKIDLPLILDKGEKHDDYCVKINERHLKRFSELFDRYTSKNLLFKVEILPATDRTFHLCLNGVFDKDVCILSNTKIGSVFVYQKYPIFDIYNDRKLSKMKRLERRYLDFNSRSLEDCYLSYWLYRFAICILIYVIFTIYIDLKIENSKPDINKERRKEHK